MFNGKRSERLELPRQLRSDAEMARTVRELAMSNRRSIQQQLLHLIERGLKSENVGNCHVASQELAPGGKRAPTEAGSGPCVNTPGSYNPRPLPEIYRRMKR